MRTVWHADRVAWGLRLRPLCLFRHLELTGAIRHFTMRVVCGPRLQPICFIVMFYYSMFYVRY